MPSEQPEQGKCGAKIANSLEKHGKIMYCTNVAGQGTDHKGTGRCKFHGGCSTGRNGITRLKKDIEKAVKGHTARIIKSSPEEFQEYLNTNDSDKMQIELELFVGKKILEEHIFQGGIPTGDDKIIKALALIMNANRQNVLDQFKIKFGDMSKFQVQIIHTIVKRLTEIEFENVLAAFKDNKTTDAKQDAFSKIVIKIVRQTVYNDEPDTGSIENVPYSVL